MTTISGGVSSSTLLQQVQQARLSAFQKADTDGSGGLSLEEFKAAGPKDANGNAIAPPPGAPGVEDMFASLDSDSDGSLSQAELDSGFGQKFEPGGQSLLSGDMITQLLGQLSDSQLEDFFNTADQNGDGSLSGDEFTSAIESLATEAGLSAGSAGGPPPGGPPPGGPPPGGPPPGGASSAESSDESDDSVLTAYDALDTNKDGTVSLQEMLAANESSTGSDTTDSDSSSSATIANLLKTDFTRFLLSLQEQQQAA